LSLLSESPERLKAHQRPRQWQGGPIPRRQLLANAAIAASRVAA